MHREAQILQAPDGMWEVRWTDEGRDLSSTWGSFENAITQFLEVTRADYNRTLHVRRTGYHKEDGEPLFFEVQEEGVDDTAFHPWNGGGLEDVLNDIFAMGITEYLDNFPDAARP